MPTSESKRLALREKLAEALGSETAGTLMEHIPPERWDELATKTDLRQLADLLRKERQADLKQLQGKVHEQFGKMHEQFGKMHEQFGEVHEQFGKMHKEVGTLKAHSAEQQTQLTAMMTNQHRTTMLMLLGVLVATVASVLIPLLTTLIPLLTSSPA